MNRAELRLVSGEAVSLASGNAPRLAGAGASPERQLRALFQRQAELKREQALVDLDLAVERRRYADRHGLITPPRMEQLRREFGQ